jgi:hypothetical protein
MSEMSPPAVVAPAETADAGASPVAVESPPPSPAPARDVQSSGDPRTRLHQLAAELIRTKNRRLLIEYLQLRRSLR